jgi:diaminohydroxyphosphoribosylaminopyrimidine deaminase/5-amino-6-(5-phosphoribosylamino)uracil reductase
MVGAVIVKDNALIASGYHERFGGPHAEVHALASAGIKARGATLYVTLEPCCHFGKTHPCTDAILAAQIARVVVAMADPFPEVNGRGLETLKARGLQVDVGCLAEPARLLNAPYLKRLTTGMPFVIAKWAMTLDGKSATAAGDSRWISSEASRATVHERRGQVDGIIAGIGTVLADDPLLTARPAGPRMPKRIVIDSAGRLPASTQLAQTAREVPVIVAVTNRASPSARQRVAEFGAEVLAFDGDGPVPLAPLLSELGHRGMTSVLVEGGGQVLGSFLDEGHVDAVDVYLAPIVEGGDHARTPVRGRGLAWMREAARLNDVAIVQLGGDARVQGWLFQAWRTSAGFGPVE